MALPKMTQVSVFFTILVFVICAFYTTYAQKNVINLEESNWQEMLKDEWMVEFYAPWCPACRALQPIWQEFATWSKDLGIKVAQVDVTTSPGLSGRFMVTALPTIFHVTHGEFRQYKGSRDANSFMAFIEEKKWEQVDPVANWKSPNSIQMSIVSSFFKLSQVLRGIHNHLLEQYGLPTWGSYLIFTLATIVLGALLGLILVCIIDFVYAPKTPTRTKPVSGDDKKDKYSDNELADEDINDDLLDDATQSEKEDSDSQSQSEEPQSSSPNVKKRKARKAD